MKEAKKRIRFIMICIVLTAIVVGVVYYYHETRDERVLERGTLIAGSNLGWYTLWQQ